MGDLDFCLSEKDIISPLFLKDSFAGCNILGWLFSPFTL
jgi:hypothetical protein